MARLLADLQDEADAELRLKVLKEARTALNSLKPSVSVRQLEWEKILRAARKLSPSITEDEVLALFG